MQRTTVQIVSGTGRGDTGPQEAFQDFRELAAGITPAKTQLARLRGESERPDLPWSRCGRPCNGAKSAKRRGRRVQAFENRRPVTFVVHAVYTCAMTGPTLVEALKALDSHERPILLQWATGTRFAASKEFASSVRKQVSVAVPSDAFIAMDYNLDWLFAASRWHLNSSVVESPNPWPGAAELLSSTGEDIDLVVAWDKPSPHLLLVEAKGFTGWTNAQLASKVARLKAIFDEATRRAITVHFLLAGPSPSKGLKVDGWAPWLLNPADGRPFFLSIDDPGPKRWVQRLDAEHQPSKDDVAYWQLALRRWSTAAEAPTATQAVTAKSRRACMRCEARPSMWLVTRLSPEGPSKAGRSYVICDRCRVAHTGDYAVAVPLSVLDEQLDGIMIELYRGGFTTTQPKDVIELLGFPAGTWVGEAERVLAETTAGG